MCPDSKRNGGTTPSPAELYPGVFDGTKLEVAPDDLLIDLSDGYLTSEGRVIHCQGLLDVDCSFSMADHRNLPGHEDASAIRNLFYAYDDRGEAGDVSKAINSMDSINMLLIAFANRSTHANLAPMLDNFNEILGRLDVSAHIPALPHRKREPNEFYPYITDAANKLGERLSDLRLQEIKRLGSVIVRDSNPTIEGMDKEDTRLWVSIDAPDRLRRQGKPILLAPLGGVAMPGTSIGPSIELMYSNRPKGKVLTFVNITEPHTKPVVIGTDSESYLLPETWEFQQPLLYRRLEYGKEAAWLGLSALSQET